MLKTNFSKWNLVLWFAKPSAMLVFLQDWRKCVAHHGQFDLLLLICGVGQQPTTEDFLTDENNQENIGKFLWHSEFLTTKS